MNTTEQKTPFFDREQAKRLRQPIRKVSKKYAIFELSEGTHQAVRRAEARDFLDSKAAENACFEILKIQPEKILIIMPIIGTQIVKT